MANWVNMREASREIGITPSKLSRMAALGRIQTTQNPYDEREKLVDLDELRQMFPPKPKRR